MSNFKFSRRSYDILQTVHPDLQHLARRALDLTTIDFSVIDGHRSITKQREYYNTGKSKTMKSAHIVGAAIDIVPILNGKADWDPGVFKLVIDAFREAANDLSIPITFGYDWQWQDCPHIELNRGAYPGVYKGLDDVSDETD